MTQGTNQRSYCVFCGSNTGGRPEFLQAARSLGSELAARGLGLIYGGAQVGLMGAVADAALERGGHVIGVIPRALAKKEVAHEGLEDLRVVGSMHERKALMADLGDGFIALPGGFGTFEELLEMLTWAQLGVHSHPCGLLNVGGYYDPLLTMMDQAVEHGFVTLDHREMVVVETDAASLLDRFDAHEPRHTTKWLDPADT